MVSFELLAKHQILLRRVASLSIELDAWIKWAAADSTLEKNFTQIEALDYFVRALCKLNKKSVNALDPAGDANIFLNDSFSLTLKVIKSQIVWDFFRDRLELRFTPQFQQPLLMADLVSHDCYTTVLDRAKALQIIPEQGFREYPLIGLNTGFSPATWRRGRRPKALQNHKLPVPIIDLPWDHLANPWELLTIAHEVGHNLDEDLGKLSQVLRPVVADQLEKVTTSPRYIDPWQRWTSEILADLIGILLTGPAFVSALNSLLMLPKGDVRHIDDMDPHPPHYLRVFINTAFLRRLGLSQSADIFETSWKALYGEPGDAFTPYLPGIEPVISTILNTPLEVLQGEDGKRYNLCELIPFTPDDQTLIQKIATKLMDGGLRDRVPIRYIVSASRLIFEQMMRAGNVADLESLAQCMRQAIIDLQPPGQLPAGLASRRVRRHLDDLAHSFLEYSIGDFGVHNPLAGRKDDKSI